jgi:hypothetical protein
VFEPVDRSPKLLNPALTLKPSWRIEDQNQESFLNMDEEIRTSSDGVGSDATSGRGASIV